MVMNGESCVTYFVFAGVCASSIHALSQPRNKMSFLFSRKEMPRSGYPKFERAKCAFH